MRRWVSDYLLARPRASVSEVHIEFQKSGSHLSGSRLWRIMHSQRRPVKPVRTHKVRSVNCKRRVEFCVDMSSRLQPIRSDAGRAQTHSSEVEVRPQRTWRWIQRGSASRTNHSSDAAKSWCHRTSACGSTKGCRNTSPPLTSGSPNTCSTRSLRTTQARWSVALSTCAHSDSFHEHQVAQGTLVDPRFSSKRLPRRVVGRGVEFFVAFRSCLLLSPSSLRRTLPGSTACGPMSVGN